MARMNSLDDLDAFAKDLMDRYLKAISMKFRLERSYSIE
jgi:hypothetical protein